MRDKRVCEEICKDFFVKSLKVYCVFDWIKIFEKFYCARECQKTKISAHLKSNLVVIVEN